MTVQALVHARRLSPKCEIFTFTHGILFFGTPHLGSPKATWIRYASVALSALKILRLPAPLETKLTAALEPDSEVLQNMTDDFLLLMPYLKIALFWEEETTSFGIFGQDFVVSRDSAAPLYDDTQRCGIASTHAGMVKFDTPDDAGFLTAMDVLGGYYREAPREIQARIDLDEDMKRLKQTHELRALGLVPDVQLSAPG